MKNVCHMVLLFTLGFGQILDWPETVYVDNCYPNQCNLAGICTNLTGNTYMCDCFTDYDGDNCGTTLTSCDNVDCGDAGTCLYDDAMPTCYCEYGWEREDQDLATSACTVEKMGVSACDVYDCGGKGQCYMLEDEPMCGCDAGWGGDTCSWQNQDVYNMFLLEMAALLTDNYPDQAENIAYDCSYLWPFVWDESPIALEIGDYTENICAPCNCISAIKEVSADNSWDTLYQWRLDSKYTLNIEELHELHCPYSTTEEEVSTFTTALSSFSDDCATVLTDDSVLPLYLKNEMICSCLTTVVDYVDDAEDFLKYPLDIAKPFASAYMNYEACTSDEGICDYEDIYGKIVLKSANVPEVAEACTSAVLSMAKSVDGNDYKEGMCTCMQTIFTYCPECGSEWFSCRASTWDWITVEDRFRQLCFDSKKVWREFAWTMNRYAMQLISVDVTGASSCSNAMTTSIARAQVPLGIDDKVTQTLCDCMSSLAANGFDSAWDEIMAIAPTGFSLEESECTSDDITIEDLNTMIADVELSSEETAQITIMVILCALIVFNLFWLGSNIQKKKSYGKLDDTENVNNMDEAVNYKTTGDR